PYRIAGLTRDASKPEAQDWLQKGVNIQQVNISPEHKAEVIKAFEGADIVFAMTSSFDCHTKTDEIAQGKFMVDAVKLCQVNLFIWSSLESPAKWSKRRLSAVWPFDPKAEITDYLREPGVPFALVQAAGYFNTLWMRADVGLVKQSGGSRTLTLPCPATTATYLVDTPRDYGMYVRAAIENPGMGAGSEVLMGTRISYENQMTQLSQFTGKKHIFGEADRDEWNSVVKRTGIPHAFGDVLFEAF
ncbi:hypothetical protein FRB97_001671, partial [Tulasnella sp. 331]